ncbi:MAG TPA: PRC-barrel domain-containing protein [Azospirillum sp.]|nr:PRC-barrel domain-containing protein [Azospirillum sp.]
MNRLLVTTILAAGLASPTVLAQQSPSSGANPPAPTQGRNQTQAQAANVPNRIQLTSASAIAGQRVLDPMGQEVGEVEYLLIDPQTGNVRYALVGSGGVFDIGEDVTPVPWSSLTVTPGENYGAVTLHSDLDKLRRGQRFSRGDIQSLTEPALVTRIFEYYAPLPNNQMSGGQMSGSQNSGDQASGSQGSGSSSSGTQQQAAGGSGGGGPDQRTASSPQGQGQPAQNQPSPGQPMILVGREYVTTLAPPALISPNEIRGSTVFARTGEDIGDIDQIMIDVQRGQVPYVLVGRGGFLGIGEDWVAVPFQALSWSATQEGFILNASEQQLEDMEVLPKENLPAQVRTSDLKKLYDHFGVKPYWSKQG